MYRTIILFRVKLSFVALLHSFNDLKMFGHIFVGVSVRLLDENHKRLLLNVQCLLKVLSSVSRVLIFRLVVPNKGYSSLDQSPDEKPLVALDTDRYVQVKM